MAIIPGSNNPIRLTHALSNIIIRINHNLAERQRYRLSHSNLSTLLNMTLDVAEAQAGALHLERVPVDLPEVVAQLVNLYLPAMADRHQEVQTDLQRGVLVDADLGLLNRTLSNLLENELVHLPDGCQIDVRLRSHEGHAELVVEDNGRDSLATSPGARLSVL